MNNKILREILDWVICAVIAYILYIIINYFIGTISGVKQSSMYPTAKEGDKLVISRRLIWKDELKYGDIITFEAPILPVDIARQKDNKASFGEYKGVNNFIYHVMGIGKKSYIKRIIAIEGDHIFISEEGKVYVNDKLLEERYLDSSVVTDRNGDYYDMIVPKDCVFVMGDNRPDSADSRVFGAIPINKVEGNVRCRIWPLNKIGKLGD